MALPIRDILPELGDALTVSSNAVLIAPPGAGKTTMVAPFLLDQNWCDGEIIILSPRRVAARSAAEHMAKLRGEKAGETIGYATRMDTRYSDRTRVHVMTEGVYLKRIQADPELTGVSAVLFDEAHERSLNSDFALALSLEAQSAFRADLKLLVMSATLNGKHFVKLLGNAPVIESRGRQYPLEHHYLGRPGQMPLSQAVAAAVRRALTEQGQGDILAFLPGIADIRRTQEALLPDGGDGNDADIAVMPLHGGLEPSHQRAALAPDPKGRRKVILATDIAQTSLTIDGLRIVIDSGMARRVHFDLASNLSHLVTQRASLAAVTQRAGRAARQSAGIVYRLWDAAETHGLVPHDPPEITQADLTDLVLQCASWGENRPERLRWIDPPSAAGLKAARLKLQRYQALDKQGAITEYGRALADMPLPPALGHMLLGAAGDKEDAALLCLLLQERGLGGRSEDLEHRLRAVRRNGRRFSRQVSLAKQWADKARKLPARGNNISGSLALCLAQSFPDLIGRRRSNTANQWLSAGGQAFFLEPSSPLAGHEWLAIADVQGGAAKGRITAALPLDRADIATLCADMGQAQTDVNYDPKSDRVTARAIEKLGAITLKKQADSTISNADIDRVLMDYLYQKGLDILPWSKASLSLRTRAQFAGFADKIGDTALLDDIEQWFPMLVTSPPGLRAIDPAALHGVLQARLGWQAEQDIARIAPEKYVSPAGTHHMIDYLHNSGPTIKLRVQALFGEVDHPNVGDPPTGLNLELLSPAGRPIQTTADLPGFWDGSWVDVCKDMAGRYPKHAWPDDPRKALASLATKKAQANKKPS